MPSTILGAETIQVKLRALPVEAVIHRRGWTQELDHLGTKPGSAT